MKKLIGGLAILTIAIVAGVGLSSAATETLSYQKISDTEGDFEATLDNNDLFGVSIHGMDVDGDGNDELIVGAPYDDDGGTNRGAVYVLFLDGNGSVTNYQKISDTQGGFTETLADGDQFGHAITSIDIDQNGVEEMIVGLPLSNSQHGKLFVLFMNDNGTVDTSQEVGDDVGGLSGLSIGDKFGDILEPLDVNGDGVEELAVGLPYMDDGGEERGGVFILFFNTNGTVSSYQPITDLQGSFVATMADYDSFGFSLYATDNNGDGNDELVVGSCCDDAGGTNRGALYVLFLNSNGTVSSYQKISDTEGGFTATLSDFDGFGRVLNGGDLNNDGRDEIFVGVPFDSDSGTSAGALYVLFLNSNGTVSSYQKISDASSELGDTIQAYGLFGSYIEVLDADGDDVVEVVVGVPGDGMSGGDTRGDAYILDLATDGSVESYIQISDDPNFEYTLDTDDSFGQGMTVADIDGDSYPELVLNAIGDDDGGSGRGAIYVAKFDISSGTTPSNPAPTPPSPPTFNIVGDSVCTWDNTLYAEVEAAQTVAVYVADNERFVASQQYIYQSGNAAAVLPEELQSSANPSKMYISWTIPEETREESIYELFALARGTNGALSAIVTDSIEYSSVTDCDYPFAAERDAEGNIVSTTPGSGNGGEETESGITPVSPGDLIKVDGDSTVYYVTQSLTKRPFTEYSIYLTWGGDSALKLVTPATLPTLQTGEPMLPKGPAIIYFEGNPNPHYIDGANNAPREATVQNVLQDLLGLSFRRDLHQTVPAYLEDHITKGRDITRANELTILREWRNFIRGL